MAADGIQPQRGFQNVEHMHSSAQTAICVELSSVGCSGQQSENVQPRFLLKMWVSTLYSDYVKDYEDQIVRHISNVNATDFMMPSVCKQSKSLVSAYIPGDFLNMPMYWHSWNTMHRTRHVWRQENMPTSLVVNIMVSGIQTWPTHASGAPANCASGALRSWCRPLTPRIVRIHWNFRFFYNMTRHDYCPSSFRGPERSIRLVRFRSAGGDSLSPLFTFQTVSDRAGSLWSFFHLTLDHALNYTPSCCKFSDGLCTNALGSGCWVWTFIGNSLQMQNWKSLPLLGCPQLPHCDNWRWTRRASVQSCKVALKQSWILMWILLTEFVAKEASELINLFISAIDWSDCRLYRKPSMTVAKMQVLVRWKTSANGTCVRCVHMPICKS